MTLVLLLFVGLSWQLPQESVYKNYRKYCNACHLNGIEVMAPSLEDIFEKRKKKWLVSFVQDEKSLREKGDRLAQEMEKYGTEKSYFKYDHQFKSDLSKKEVVALLEYMTEDIYKDQN